MFCYMYFFNYVNQLKTSFKLVTEDRRLDSYAKLKCCHGDWGGQGIEVVYLSFGTDFSRVHISASPKKSPVLSQNCLA